MRKNFPRIDKHYFRETKEILGFSKTVSLGNEPGQEKTRRIQTELNNNAKEKSQRGRRKKGRRRGEKREKEKGRESLL